MSLNMATNGGQAPIGLHVRSLARGEPMDPFPDGVSDHSVVIIDSRALDRECFAQSMAARSPDVDILNFGTVEEWKRVRDQYAPVSAILFHVGGRNIGDVAAADEIRKLCKDLAPTPVVLLADTDEMQQVLKALDYGAKGYIPTSVGMGVCIEAVALAVAGGIFVPASSVLAMRKILESGGDARPLAGMFTLRQTEVAEALRRGKANKIIAYELNLRESTVKVHIRNIMRKLKATNRTEVAFKINDLFLGS